LVALGYRVDIHNDGVCMLSRSVVQLDIMRGTRDTGRQVRRAQVRSDLNLSLRAPDSVKLDVINCWWPATDSLAAHHVHYRHRSSSRSRRWTLEHAAIQVQSSATTDQV